MLFFLLAANRLNLNFCSKCRKVCNQSQYNNAGVQSDTALGKRGGKYKARIGSCSTYNKVLVTAQMVTDATYIELEKPDSSEKTSARVVTVDYEANLAILEPTDNKSFLSDREPFLINEQLAPSDQLEAWQFESNGTPVTTKITVSKAEVRQSFLETSKFLQVQANGPVQYRS